MRGLLKKDGHYANYWPAGLDLEDRIYRPLLVKVLFPAWTAFAALFGENRILRPLAKGVFLIWCVILRALEMSTDALAVLARKTFLKEKVVGRHSKRPGLAGVMAEELQEAARPIISNFTFALLMTCVGIVVILFTIVYTAVL